MTTLIQTKFIALAAALGLMFSTALLAPAAFAHDDGSSGHGCHSHDGGDKRHCH